MTTHPASESYRWTEPRLQPGCPVNTPSDLGICLGKLALGHAKGTTGYWTVNPGGGDCTQKPASPMESPTVTRQM